MGLSEPRKRLKIAHDPRNLSWSTAAPSSSVGHRLMTSQGWSEGQALGARAHARTPSITGTGTSTSTSTRIGSGSANDNNADDATRLAMSKVRVLFKDDTLGLGAKLKSKDVEGQRTGLDAFANVLGRLNSRTEEEVVRHETKESERKLAGYARGRWGGMVFVPGGVLVQGEGFKSAQEEGIEERRKKMGEQKGIGEGERHEGEQQVVDTTASSGEDRPSTNETAQKKRQKEERRRRKEERRLRKSAKAAAVAVGEEQRASTKKKSKKSKSASISAPDEATSSSDDDEAGARSDEVSAEQSKTKQRASSVVVTETIKKEIPRSGRHILRGRNIEAKRKAFSDTKGLDAIFMR